MPNMLMFSKKKLEENHSEWKATNPLEVYNLLEKTKNAKSGKEVSLSAIVNMAKKTTSLYESYIKEGVNTEKWQASNTYYGKTKIAFSQLRSLIEVYYHNSRTVYDDYFNELYNHMSGSVSGGKYPFEGGNVTVTPAEPSK